MPLGDDVEGVVHVVVEELLPRLDPPARKDADPVVAPRQHDARQAVGRLVAKFYYHYSDYYYFGYFIFGGGRPPPA